MYVAGLYNLGVCKLQKSMVFYRAVAPCSMATCANCDLYMGNATVPISGQCRTVSGTIAPNGWCAMWIPGVAAFIIQPAYTLLERLAQMPAAGACYPQQQDEPYQQEEVFQ
jgi:hypothetical protein